MRCDNCDDEKTLLIKVRHSYQSWREGLEEYEEFWVEGEWCLKCVTEYESSL